MIGPLGNSVICYPRISMFPSNLSWETLRLAGNKIHFFPWDQPSRVNCWPTYVNLLHLVYMPLTFNRGLHCSLTHSWLFTNQFVPLFLIQIKLKGKEHKILLAIICSPGKLYATATQIKALSVTIILFQKYNLRWLTVYLLRTSNCLCLQRTW